MPASGTTPFFLPPPWRHWGRVCSPAVSGPQTAILWEAVGHRPLWGRQPGATLLASCRHEASPPRWRRRCEPGPEFCPRRRRPPSPGCSGNERSAGSGLAASRNAPTWRGSSCTAPPMLRPQENCGAKSRGGGRLLPWRLGKDPGRAEPAERDGAPPPLQRSAPGGALEWRRKKTLEGRAPLWRPRSMAFSRPASGEIARKPACQFPFFFAPPPQGFCRKSREGCIPRMRGCSLRGAISEAPPPPPPPPPWLRRWPRSPRSRRR